MSSARRRFRLHAAVLLPPCCPASTVRCAGYATMPAPRRQQMRKDEESAHMSLAPPPFRRRLLRRAGSRCARHGMPQRCAAPPRREEMRGAATPPPPPPRQSAARRRPRRVITEYRHAPALSHTALFTRKHRDTITRTGWGYHACPLFTRDYERRHHTLRLCCRRPCAEECAWSARARR